MERYMTRRDTLVRETVKEEEEEEEEDCERDLLYLVHSDISSLLHQIDELVVKATKLKTLSKQEVESFRSVLSDMHSSLTPWFPRLQAAISSSQLLSKVQEEQSLMSSASKEELYDVESPEPTGFEPLVSPSPLVAWRGGDHNPDKGRQLFMLTPLPLRKSEFLKSKLKSKRVFPNSAATQPLQASKETSDCGLGVESMKTAGLGGNSLVPLMDLSESLVESEPLPSVKIQSQLLMTPCLKMSPPKTRTLFKPVPQRGKQEACKSTCSELGASTFNGSQSSESSGIDETDDLYSKYPELMGLKHAPIARKTDLEASPVWWFSPPKTSVLLELPVNEKKPTDETGVSRTVSSFAFTNVKPEAAAHTKEASRSMVVESTPLMNEAESVMTKNRTRAGESTLKKELWTRFEEASMHENRFSSKTTTTTTMRGNKKKGFMEMLEEVCGNEEHELN
ncbi:unnamed protein product [Brassica oleracea var. botrytis]|uniref:Uncharacterized protein n=3 Tax=Brassica TaxID=3705 RepID=A0A8X7UEU2_BRACI|nr:uncharacterized protein BNAC09G23210D [Brassica napus]XP_013713090.1 uncharacterized protein BNAC09G23210D [Brassica napus]XP_013713091.1 uncharacterized protein BNAC09G23210D [Brassica napus]KAG2276152.1 hypothetical protein Bca52824_058707 [Brassica carinata]VDD30915.1 unnamed protein product [Brassica oleracea]KAH0858555.1 hypothetical protein HID58_086816 [Brassica napus]CAF1742683.1 unnamed protein product [Brassica napus]